MSDNVELDNAKKEIQSLKSQLAQSNNVLQGIIAQLDAHKGELSDSRVISLQLRTNLVVAQKSNAQLADSNKELENKFDSMNKQFEDATAKIKSYYEDNKAAEPAPPILKEVANKGK